MSHLESNANPDLIFRQSEYNRLATALTIGYIMLFSGIFLGGAMFFGAVQLDGALWYAAITVDVVLNLGGIILIAMMFGPALQMRRIRDAIGGLVHVLDHQLDRIHVSESHVFNTIEHGLIKVTRRGDSNWTVQSYRIGDELDARPYFQAAISTYRVTDVNQAGILLSATSFNLCWLKHVRAVIASECEMAGLSEIMVNEESRKATNSIDELEKLVNQP